MEFNRVSNIYKPYKCNSEWLEHISLMQIKTIFELPLEKLILLDLTLHGTLIEDIDLLSKDK